MRKSLSVPLLVALAIATPLSAQQPSQAPIKIEDAIRKTIEQYATAWNARDAHGLAQLYTMSGDYTGFESAMTRGRQDIEQRYSELLSGLLAGSLASVEVSSIRLITSDVALVDGIVRLSDGSGRQTAQGAYMAVMTPEEGQWRITSFWSKSTQAASGASQ